MRTIKLSRTHIYRIEEADGAPELIGKKCRLCLPAEGIDCELVAGFALDLQAYMLTGKQKGSVVELPPVKLKYSEIPPCRCGAYKFPHAPGLGQCKGEQLQQEAPQGLNIKDIFTTEKIA